MIEVYFCLGSNLGDREATIKKSIFLIRKCCDILQISSLYETEPVGFRDQSWFINCVVRARTKLSPHELMREISKIEASLGKKIIRKNGPRTIDIDILLYGDEEINEGDLTIPHPRFHERAFVLVPFAEIASERAHPALGMSIKKILQGLKSSKEVKKIR